MKPEDLKDFVQCTDEPTTYTWDKETQTWRKSGSERMNETGEKSLQKLNQNSRYGKSEEWTKAYETGREDTLLQLAEKNPDRYAILGLDRGGSVPPHSTVAVHITPQMTCRPVHFVLPWRLAVRSLTIGTRHQFANLGDVSADALAKLGPPASFDWVLPSQPIILTLENPTDENVLLDGGALVELAPLLTFEPCSECGGERKTHSPFEDFHLPKCSKPNLTLTPGDRFAPRIEALAKERDALLLENAKLRRSGEDLERRLKKGPAR